jgi:hypothetical protein
MFSRDQLKRAGTLTEEDFVQLDKCRRPHNRLGFAYQVAFVRLFNRFPQQQPFELIEELVCFSAAQLRLDARLIELYRKRFARLEEFFIDDRRWQSIREDFFRRSGLPSDTKQVQEYLARRLGEAYERFLKTAPSNSYAVVDKDGWRLSAEPTEKLDQEEQDRLAHLNPGWQSTCAT